MSDKIDFLWGIVSKRLDSHPGDDEALKVAIQIAMLAQDQDRMKLYTSSGSTNDRSATAA